ncbi:MAG TPA: signal peptidase II, partial [Caldilineaceae bacterium]|nr:signal peptidase II [Caldilineaceae bacterium]
MAQKLSLGSLAQRWWIVLITAGVVIGLDRWTKELIRAAMPLYSSTVPIPSLEGYLSFQHVNNYGAAFGIFQGGRIFFTVVAFAVSAGILYYAAQHLPLNERFVRLLLGLEMGGAIGNVID